MFDKSVRKNQIITNLINLLPAIGMLDKQQPASDLVSQLLPNYKFDYKFTDWHMPLSDKGIQRTAYVGAEV